jgi:hypothetical protein
MTLVVPEQAPTASQVPFSDTRVAPPPGNGGASVKLTWSTVLGFDEFNT